MKMDTHIPNYVFSNRIQLYLKGIMCHVQVRFIPGIQGWFNIWKPNNVFHNKFVRLIKKNHMSTPTDTDKTLDKISHPSMLRTFRRIGIKENFLIFLKKT